MIRPAWLSPLGAREEKTRAAHGLIAKLDGWYKTFDGRTSYICKPATLADAVAVLPGRIEAIRQKRKGGDVPAVRVTLGNLTLDQVAEAYRDWLWQRLKTGVPRKLERRTYDDSVREVDLFVERAGGHKPADAIGPAEFTAYALEHLAGIAASSIRRKMIYVEAFANWAAPGKRKAGLLVRPWQYGENFRKPSEDEITTSAADSDKAYTAQQLRQAFLKVKRNPFLRAAGWLALCGAFAPKDLSRLPESLVNFDTGIIQFPRGKTGVGRCCWLPPCAREAVRRYIATRPDAAEPAAEPLLFRSVTGLPMYRESSGEDPGYRNDRIGHRWSEATGLPLSGLRSTFATHADDWPDQRAVDIAMGHKSGHQTRSVRNKSYAKKFNPERARLLVSAVVPLAFGRRIPSSLSVLLPASSVPPAPAGPRDSDAKPPRRRGRSSNAGSKTPASVRPKPSTRPQR